MRKFGLIGYPLSHSFSKKYFTDKFFNEGLVNCRYDNYPLTNILSLYDLLQSDNQIEGLNVTIPYKSKVMDCLDFIDPDALSVGAVNVLKINRVGDGMKVLGFNSDITGIKDTIAPLMSPSLKNALILGTGGASKAVRYVLRNLGINYTVVSRTSQPDCLTYNEIEPRLYNEIQIIINTTPLGMFPDTKTMPLIRYDLLRREHILFDLVYNPEITAFLKKGSEKGCTIINGLKMLYSQAEKSWEIWNNPDY